MWQLLASLAGPALGAFGKGSAQNRDAKFSGQMDLARLLMERDQGYYSQQLAREQDSRASSSDAWRKLLAASRIEDPGARPQLSPYSVAPRTATYGEQAGAHGLREEALQRLMGGYGGPTPTRTDINVDPRLLNAGKGESILGWLAPLLTGAGAFGQKKAGE